MAVEKEVIFFDGKENKVHKLDRLPHHIEVPVFEFSKIWPPDDKESFHTDIYEKHVMFIWMSEICRWEYICYILKGIDINKHIYNIDWGSTLVRRIILNRYEQEMMKFND